MLSTLVAEIVVGMGADRIVETKAPEPKVERQNVAAHKAINETKTKCFQPLLNQVMLTWEALMYLKAQSLKHCRQSKQCTF